MKLNGVLCCINYDDYLAHTLPSNISHFDNFAVVTQEEDTATQKIIKELGAICVFRQSKEGFDANGTKGMAINEGIAALHASADWILHLDADIILPSDFRTKLEKFPLNPEFLYWTERKQPSTEEQLTEFFKNTNSIHSWEGSKPPGSPHRWSGPFGYFQLFNLTSKALHGYPTVYPEKQATGDWLKLSSYDLNFDWAKHAKIVADCTDGAFNNRWPTDKKVKLPEYFTVLHLPHGPSRINWSGRKSERFSYPNTPPGFFV